MKKPVKIFLILTILYSVSFCAAEMLLRIFDPLGVEYFSEVVKYFDQLVTKENYSYIHPAGMDKEFQGVRIKTNSAGLRGPEITAAGNGKQKRILILGDSVVLGWGVEYNETFPAVIQRDLSRIFNNTIVIPAGVSSWNTRTEYEFFRENVDMLDPDILILITVSNDTDPKDNSNIEIGKEKLEKLVYRPKKDQNIFKKIWFFLVEKSYVFRHFQFIVKIITEKDQNLRASRNNLTWQDTELALNKLIKLCNERKIYFLPYFYASDEMALNHPIYSMYSEYYNENGLNFRTLPDELFEGYRYRNSVIDNHPNAEGHRIIAKVLSSKIVNILKAEGFR